MIGWRLRKHYFRTSSRLSSTKNTTGQTPGMHQLIKSGSQPQTKQHQLQSSTSSFNGSLEIPAHSTTNIEHVLAWTEFGPDRYVCEKEIQNTFKYISELQHPFIEPIDYIASNDSGALIVRKFYTQGSVKDLLCGSLPKNPFLRLRLRFLHSKGHIHAGNVIIVDGVARLLDIENFILGVPSFYRLFFDQHSKISTVENVDVYSFGHLMYEMSMGYPLQESITRHPIECSESLKHLLESILSKEACKVGLPTLDQLVEHRFFTENVPRFNEQYTTLTAIHRPHFKLSASAKEQLKTAIQKIEIRLQSEQKSVKHQKRLVRVQEMMTSEEEKKKIKQKAKVQKQTKLRQQNSLQLGNASSGGQLSPLPRSDSIHSISTMQSCMLVVSGATLQPPPPLPPPALQLPAAVTSGTTNERSALLSSINNFNKAALKKVALND